MVGKNLAIRTNRPFSPTPAYQFLYSIQDFLPEPTSLSDKGTYLVPAETSEFVLRECCRTQFFFCCDASTNHMCWRSDKLILLLLSRLTMFLIISRLLDNTQAASDWISCLLSACNPPNLFIIVFTHVHMLKCGKTAGNFHVFGKNAWKQ